MAIDIHHLREQYDQDYPYYQRLIDHAEAILQRETEMQKAVIVRECLNCMNNKQNSAGFTQSYISCESP